MLYALPDLQNLIFPTNLLYFIDKKRGLLRGFVTLLASKGKNKSIQPIERALNHQAPLHTEIKILCYYRAEDLTMN